MVMWLSREYMQICFVSRAVILLCTANTLSIKQEEVMGIKAYCAFWIQRQWYKSNLFSLLLLPVAVLYASWMFCRRQVYKVFLSKNRQFSVPIVIVGNITVGGTGKTPALIAMALALRTQGYKPGIVSRGFGGKAKKWPQVVQNNSDPLMVGDEPVLLARKTGCPVVVAPNRVVAVHTLLAKYACNIVLSDDGLQHYALARDIEINVIDAARGLGNGYCLPVGPLREPVSRLEDVMLHLLHTSEAAGPLSPVAQQSWQRRIGPAPLYSMYLAPGEIYNLKECQQVLCLVWAKQYRWKAVAGIGNPERFFLQLEQLGWEIERVAFPDHHIFSEKDLQCAPGQQLIMTEKDAVKCQAFAQPAHWVFPVHAILPEAFYTQLLQAIEQKKGHKSGLQHQSRD
eukprot:TRINITY_DN47312_c0_g1_i1.p1 TRINITY_DN47312_c0_g1~~TRINITY_DN47312_c0_g1_i1.p1  ORF type:complete len:398 (+),score=-73.97 TRINITY_DN47312_c0_g1_i1:955-2148(+)